MGVTLLQCAAHVSLNCLYGQERKNLKLDLRIAKYGIILSDSF